MSEWKKQLRNYIATNVFAMIGMSCYVLADTFFISIAQGANGITALNLTLPVYNLIFAIGAMVGLGSATRYTIGRAAGREDADLYFSNGFIWLALISIPFVLTGIFGAEAVLRLFGADDTIVAVGGDYLRIALIFTPCFMLNYMFTDFVRNDGAPKVSMTATVVSSLFNILFDYILMFPCGLGMVGAALATAVSPLVSIAICLTHFFSKENHIKFVPHATSVKRLGQCIPLGVSAFVGEFASGVTTLCFNYLLLSIAGNTAVAAYGVTANMALVAVGMFNGISKGIQPLASKAYGAGDQEKMRFTLSYGLKVGITLEVILVGLVLIFAPQCVAVFNSEGSAEMAAYAEYGIRIYFLGFLFAGVNLIGTGYLGAIGRGRESSTIAILRGVILIVAMAFLLSAIFGITGVWCSFPATELICLLVFILIYRKVISEPREVL